MLWLVVDLGIRYAKQHCCVFFFFLNQHCFQCRRMRVIILCYQSDMPLYGCSLSQSSEMLQFYIVSSIQVLLNLCMLKNKQDAKNITRELTLRLSLYTFTINSCSPFVPLSQSLLYIVCFWCYDIDGLVFNSQWFISKKICKMTLLFAIFKLFTYGNWITLLQGVALLIATNAPHRASYGSGQGNLGWVRVLQGTSV